LWAAVTGGVGPAGWVRRSGGVSLTATHSAARVGGGHDLGIRGPGLLSQFVERGAVARLRVIFELARGLATPPGPVTAPLSEARRVEGWRWIRRR
jgi:hypothetical protein